VVRGFSVGRSPKQLPGLICLNITCKRILKVPQFFPVLVRLECFNFIQFYFWF